MHLRIYAFSIDYEILKKLRDQIFNFYSQDFNLMSRLIKFVSTVKIYI